MEDKDFYWLVGLLEGEGSFMAGPPSKPNSPIIALQMTDEDIIIRVANLFSVSYWLPRKELAKANGWKQSYMLYLRGTRAVAFMKLLLPHMGIRRQEQIRRAIASHTPGSKSKVTQAQVAEIKCRLEAGEKHRVIAADYNIERSTVSHIKRGKIAYYK